MTIGDVTSSEERLLGELRDRIEIERLVADYCHGCDKRDVELFCSLWHPDAEWRIGEPYGDFFGVDDIRHALVDLIWSALPKSHHWTTNLALDFEGADLAHAVSDCTADGEDSEGRTITISATYTDRFERRDGRWKFASRVCDIHYFKALQLDDFGGLTVPAE